MTTRLAALLTYPVRAVRWRVQVWRARRALAVAEHAWSWSYPTTQVSRDLYAECCAADEALEAVLAARPTLGGGR